MTKKSQKEGRFDNLKVPYRLEILKEETFERVSSFSLSLLNIYTIICTLFVISAIIVVLAIFFTPLKRLVPGYADVESNREFVEMRKRMFEIEEILNAQEAYTSNFQKILTGNIEFEEPAEIPEQEIDFNSVERIKEDELLRLEIENEETFERSKNSKFEINTSPTTSLEQIHFIPPLIGEISAEFMAEEDHLGIDIIAPKNTAVKSCLSGFVISSDWTMETGNTIGIQHQNDIVSFYKHNSNLLKKVGDYVEAGEAVAIIGNTGALTDGPHLHFELWFRGKPINPLDFMAF